MDLHAGILRAAGREDFLRQYVERFGEEAAAAAFGAAGHHEAMVCGVCAPR